MNLLMDDQSALLEAALRCARSRKQRAWVTEMCTKVGLHTAPESLRYFSMSATERSFKNLLARLRAAGFVIDRAVAYSFRHMVYSYRITGQGPATP